MPRSRTTPLLLISLLLLAGCERVLIPTPNVYLDSPDDPFADVPPALQSNEVDILYITDRAPLDEVDEARLWGYGYERSRSLAYGSCIVEMGRNVSWDELAAASRSRKRTVHLPLRVVSFTEQQRFPDTPPPLELDGGEIEATASYKSTLAGATAALHDDLERRLALTPRKEVFLFVHGFKNSITDAAFRLAELWHFLGREGVPVLYSWPAGAPGLLRGYTRDRESGEFTIYHLKQAIEAIASCPDVLTINIIAHSRGTDVLMSALREMIMVCEARGGDPVTELKIGEVVLAAPDLDIDVVSQRISAELIYDGMKHITVYVTEKDRALGTAEWLFANPGRLGKVRPDDFDARAQQRGQYLRNVTIIDARVKTDYTGHGYFLSNPATCSDLILMMRYDRPVGAEGGRPLTQVVNRYHILDDRYPDEAAPIPRKWRNPAEPSSP